jgi:hypothetical protein
MSAPNIDTLDIKRFLDILAAKTRQGWQHRFHTTNWDYLLQHEISQRFPFGTVKPWWLTSSHVYHHNGTAEDPSSDPLRSQFLLESDPQNARKPSHESETAFEKLVSSRLFVVVGMSFECSVDRFLFSALEQVQEHLPVGESCWVVMNPSANTLRDTHSKILDALPATAVCTRALTFGHWVQKGLPELVYRGVFEQ